MELHQWRAAWPGQERQGGGLLWSVSVWVKERGQGCRLGWQFYQRDFRQVGLGELVVWAAAERGWS